MRITKTSIILILLLISTSFAYADSECTDGATSDTSCGINTGECSEGTKTRSCSSSTTYECPSVCPTEPVEELEEEIVLTEISSGSIPLEDESTSTEGSGSSGSSDSGISGGSGQSTLYLEASTSVGEVFSRFFNSLFGDEQKITGAAVQKVIDPPSVGVPCDCDLESTTHYHWGVYGSCGGTYVGPATETCDGSDNDCDGVIDEDSTGVADTLKNTYYTDSDLDGYGTTTTTSACSVPDGYVTNSDDCNDEQSTVYPGSIEVCDNTFDDDCDSYTDLEDQDCLEIVGIEQENEVGAGEIFEIKCEVNMQTNCVDVKMQGLTDNCRFTETWEDNKAIFSCQAPDDFPLRYTAYCYISNKDDQKCSLDTQESDIIFPYVYDPEVPNNNLNIKNKNVDIVEPSCVDKSTLNCDDPDTCECTQNELCGICEGCSGALANPYQGIKTCSLKTTCQSQNYLCDEGICGATCDFGDSPCPESNCENDKGCYLNGEIFTPLTYSPRVVDEEIKPVLPPHTGFTPYEYPQDISESIFYNCLNIPNDCDGNSCGCSDNQCLDYASCPESFTDFDGDGYSTQCGGDCDDENREVYPGATEVCGDLIADSNCDGVDDEIRVCCAAELSTDLDLDNFAISNNIDYFTKDKVRDFTYNVGNNNCDEVDHIDFCQDETTLIEYLAKDKTFEQQEITCIEFCETKKENTQTESEYQIIEDQWLDYKNYGYVFYSKGLCNDGACESAKLEDECGINQELTEYYCEGSQIKSIKKDCDDYDGFYEDETQGRVYKDYSCNAGQCESDISVDDSNELKQGQVRVTIKNNGTIPFSGNLITNTLNFCGSRNIILDQEIFIPIHETNTYELDFLTQGNCRPVNEEYNCRTEKLYNTFCAWGIGDGCGLVTKQEQELTQCNTCCNDFIYQPNAQEQCDLIDANPICSGTLIQAQVFDEFTGRPSSEISLKDATWCCV